MAESYSLTTVFVLPVSNTLPTTGSTADLTANQFGVFKPNYTPATVLNVAAQPYVILAQGRPQKLPWVGTKKSDKIYTKHVQEWYKVTAVSSSNNQIIEVSDWSAECSEDVTISIRLKAFYIDTGYFNGLTKSFTLTTPCCDCGENPCDTTDIQALVDRFVVKINTPDLDTTSANDVTSYIVASRSGSGPTSKLVITGKAIAAEPTSADPTVFPFQYDRIYFWVFAYKGPETSQDYVVWDSCDPLATVTTTQASNYKTGSSREALKLERDYNSNNTSPIARRLWSNVNFDGGYLSQVVDGTYYDFYYLKFLRPQINDWNATNPQDEAVILLNPTGQNAGTVAVLTAYLGNPVDESPA